MDTPGKLLKSAREKQKMSLTGLARGLNMSSEYLKAIEDDQYSLLPAEVFTRAYLRIYADTLGLKNTNILNLYNVWQEKSRSGNNVHSDGRIHPTAIKRVLRRAQLWWLIPPAVLAVLLVISAPMMKGTEKEKNRRNADAVMAKPAPPENIEDAKAGELNLIIIADELTWISISTDNEPPGEWLMRAGESMSATAMNRFGLKIGNAGGTRLILNNRDVGTLGPRGKVVDITLPLGSKTR